MTKIKDRVLRTQDMTEEFMEKWSKTFGRTAIIENAKEGIMTKEELDEQIKNISEVLKNYTPPKIKIGILTEDLIKNLKDIQIRGIYKAEPTIEFIEKSMVDVIKSKIDDLHQEIEAFQMTIDEFREKIGNNLEKIEMLEEILEDYKDEIKCEEYEKENCGNNGDFNTDNYWRSPY